MTLITHNISTANDGLGDQLRTAFGNQIQWTPKLYTTTNGLRIDLTAAVTGASGISIVPTAAQAVRVFIIHSNSREHTPTTV
jgi:hypothetical protein